MKIWHPLIIPFLYNKHLKELHQLCCSFRGLEWGIHPDLQYIWDAGLSTFVIYHYEVLKEMYRRNITSDYRWINPTYRGEKLKYQHSSVSLKVFTRAYQQYLNDRHLYDKHDLQYYKDCVLEFETLYKGVNGNVKFNTSTLL